MLRWAALSSKGNSSAGTVRSSEELFAALSLSLFSFLHGLMHGPRERSPATHTRRTSQPAGSKTALLGGGQIRPSAGNAEVAWRAQPIPGASETSGKAAVRRRTDRKSTRLNSSH